MRASAMRDLARLDRDVAALRQERVVDRRLLLGLGGLRLELLGERCRIAGVLRA
jgi:hypothetical protein